MLIIEYLSLSLRKSFDDIANSINFFVDRVLGTQWSYSKNSREF